MSIVGPGRWGSAAALALLGACAAPTGGTKPAAPEPGYDLVIRNGRMLDGAGNPWVRADVAVRGGTIAKIGRISERGRREIDATGRYVSPGWIDMMDQSGQVLLENGAAENKLRMGVTTLIAGEGGTPVPAAEIGGYFARLEQQGIAVNFGTYFSSGQARVKVMGDGAGRPTPAQMAAMKVEVALALEAGAFGISSALIYPPESFQTTADLIELAKVAARCGGFYATHMRDESENLVSAIREAVEIGEKGGVKVEIFHLKAAYAPGWGRLMP
ncbi:MAG: D-aminoacylase, partial [Actinomycetota bacterium]